MLDFGVGSDVSGIVVVDKIAAPGHAENRQRHDRQRKANQPQRALFLGAIEVTAAGKQFGRRSFIFARRKDKRSAEAAETILDAAAEIDGGGLGKIFGRTTALRRWCS